MKKKSADCVFVLFFQEGKELKTWQHNANITQSVNFSIFNCGKFITMNGIAIGTGQADVILFLIYSTIAEK